MTTELTGRQMETQDAVDNAIFNLLNELMPHDWRGPTGDGATEAEREQHLEWDGDAIGMVRDAVFEALVGYFKIPEAEKDAFEMAFYPYIELEDAQCLLCDNPTTSGRYVNTGGFCSFDCRDDFYRKQP